MGLGASKQDVSGSSTTPVDKADFKGQGQTLPARDERQPRSAQNKGSAATPMKPANKADHNKRLLQLCHEGCKADISEFSNPLSQGVDINIYDENGRHPLWYASYYGRKDLIDLFFQHNAVVDLPANGEFGSTALIIASQEGHLECATVLLKHKANVNFQRKDGNHPLLYASYYGRKDLIDLFLQHNAEVDLPTNTKFGDTALIATSQEGHLECATVLLKHKANVNYPRKDGFTALYFASRYDHTDVVTLLLDQGADVNKGVQPPLYVASHQGNLTIVKILVSRGARIDQPCDDHLAATPLLTACGENHLQVANYLIHKGANINSQAKDGWSSLHCACESGHTNVVRLLLEAQADLQIKNHEGQTPLDVARKYRHSEIASLLEKANHTSSATNEESSSDISAQTEGEEPSDTLPAETASVSDSEEPSTEEIPREREARSNSTDVQPLIETPKDGYVCVAKNLLCLVYLPRGINEKLAIETVTDAKIGPTNASNEIQITPVVRITSDNPGLSLKKPAIIELVKTIELSDKEANNKVIPLCANSESSAWKEVGSKCNCKVLNNRISLEVTHFSLYTVISRKPCPSSTVKVKPSADIPTPDHSSTPTELTISELPGFKVQIPASSVNADREIDITATVLYDSPAVCSEDDRSRLASSCIELEPHGTIFSEEVSISIPILNYAQVKEHDPNAQLQIWHANKRSDSFTKQDWNLVEHSICRDKEGRYVAIVLTKHFSWFQPLWDTYSWVTSLFYAPFGIKERCQVFMSQETRIKQSHDITFSIAVVFYPYKEEPEPVPCNYKYMLLDSGLLDLNVSNKDAIQFAVELNEQLSPKKNKSIAESLVISGRQQKSFTVELDGQVELQGGFPMGELSIGVKEQNHHVLSLIKPVDETSDLASSQAAFLPSTTTAYQFEESIIAIEDAAEKLGEDATQYKDTPVPMVEATKRIANMWTTMAQLLRKECLLKERRFKEDIVNLAKGINKESQVVVRIATNVAGECTDSIMEKTVYGVVEKIQTISHQLRILAAGEATRQRDEASDLEACRMLTTNANNLNSAISEALHHSHSAGIRISKTTRMELGLTGKLSQYHKVKDDIDGDHYQDDSHQGAVCHTQQNFSWTEEKDGAHLSDSDHSSIYYKLEYQAANWRDIGKALGFLEGELNVIENSPSLIMQAPKSFLREVLTQWLQWAPGDGRGSTSYATKESLHAALLKANLGQLAEQFQ